MANADEVQLVFRAVDQMSETLKAIEGQLGKMGATSKATTSSIETLGAKVTSVAQAIKTGFGAALGFDVFQKLDQGIHDIIGLIPAAISAGNAYIEQVHAIGVETGMTAEQSSLLLAAFKEMGLPTDNLGALLARLSLNLSNNEKNFKDLGVATRDAKGNMLGAYDIVQNLRQAISAHGDSLLSTAAAQRLFGRAGYDLMPLLQLTNAQFAALAKNAQASGLILSEQAVQGARQLALAFNDLGGAIQGIQTGIASQVDPYLASLVSQFSNLIKAHTQDIVNFVLQIVGFVVGVLNGLFGLGLNIDPLIKSLSQLNEKVPASSSAVDNWGQKTAKGAAGQDALTKSINAQVKAIDEQIRAIDKATAARHASEQGENLKTTVQQAQLNLANVQGQTPDTYGMGSAQAALAVQQHNQAVLDAQKALNTAEEALTNFGLDQTATAHKNALEAEKQKLQDRLAAHKSAGAGVAAVGLKMAADVKSSSAALTSSIESSFKKTSQAMAGFLADGQNFAEQFKTVIFGTLTMGPNQGPGQRGWTRSGGLIGSLQSVGTALISLAKTAMDVASFVMALAQTVDHWTSGILSTQHTPSKGNPFGVWNPLGLNLGGGATGGDFGPGVIRVGEQGPEKLLLPEGGTVVPHSTTGEPASGPRVIQLVVDGRVLGEVLDSMGYWAAATGSSSIRPVGAF